jgi:AraC family transcriptional regulator, activator of mtrCDE
MHKSYLKEANTMQNCPEFCKVIYESYNFSPDFPVNYLGNRSYSPSVDPVSFMHYHNYLELGYCYKGSGIFLIDEKVLPFSAGDASIVFENQIHIAQSDAKDPSDWKFVTLDTTKLLSNFDFTDLGTLSGLLKRIHSSENIYKKSSAANIPALINEIIMEMESCKDNYQIMTKLLIGQMILKLCRECRNNNEESNNSNYFNRIKKISSALKYITDNYATEINIQTLAQLCFMSLTNFRRTFKSATGKSPGEYLHTVRIKMASILLLNSNDSILEISLKVGYPTVSSFNRHYKSILGMSPRDWRKTKHL